MTKEEFNKYLEQIKLQVEILKEQCKKLEGTKSYEKAVVNLERFERMIALAEKEVVKAEEKKESKPEKK